MSGLWSSLPHDTKYPRYRKDGVKSALSYCRNFRIRLKEIALSAFERNVFWQTVLTRRPHLMRSTPAGTPVTYIKGHELVIELYKKAGFCEACNHLIVGFQYVEIDSAAPQVGFHRVRLKCKKCKGYFHPRCKDDLKHPCPGPPIGSFNFSRTNSQGSQSSIEALSPPILHGDADEQVDAVYQVLKQGAMLRASERTEEDPILARRQASLSAQNSLEVTENGSATQQSETTTTTNHVEASSSVTTTTSSSSCSTTKSMKVTSSSSSVVSKPPISNSKSKGSSSSSKTENYTIEYKQETAVGAAAVTTEKKKGVR